MIIGPCCSNGFECHLRVPLVEQELPTLPEHLSSPQVFSGVPVTRSLVLYVMFCTSLFVLLAIVLSVRVRFTDSDYPFGVFKLFLRDNLNLTLYLISIESTRKFSYSKCCIYLFFLHGNDDLDIYYKC